MGRELLKQKAGTAAALEALRDKYYVWNEFNITLLRKSFTTVEQADNYASVRSETASKDLQEARLLLLGDIRSSIRKSESAKEQLPLFDEVRPAKSQGSGRKRVRRGRAIFLVHGRNEGVMRNVEQFVVDATGVKPIILADQPGLGLTLMEKFETQASKATFAIVILTGDDEGHLKGAKAMHDRARQNVVLELGWFVGRLGRRHVAMLYQSGVELPSDMDGVLYAELDPGEGWKSRRKRSSKAGPLTADECSRS